MNVSAKFVQICSGPELIDEYLNQELNLCKSISAYCTLQQHKTSREQSAVAIAYKSKIKDNK